MKLIAVMKDGTRRPCEVKNSLSTRGIYFIDGKSSGYAAFAGISTDYPVNGVERFEKEGEEHAKS